MLLAVIGSFGKGVGTMSASAVVQGVGNAAAAGAAVLATLATEPGVPMFGEVRRLLIADAVFAVEASGMEFADAVRGVADRYYAAGVGAGHSAEECRNARAAVYSWGFRESWERGSAQIVAAGARMQSVLERLADAAGLSGAVVSLDAAGCGGCGPLLSP